MSTGLLPKSKAPARPASTAVSRVPRPDSSTPSTAGSLALKARSRSRPPSSAFRWMSETTRSKGAASRRASASPGRSTVSISRPGATRSSRMKRQVSGSSSTTSSLDMGGLRIRAREPNGNARPYAVPAREVHRPAVGGDDLAHDREPQAGSPAGGLRGEERVEHLAHHLGRHATPRVGHRHLHAPVELSRAQPKPPAFGHGVAAVRDQVQEGLLDLAGIHED